MDNLLLNIVVGLVVTVVGGLILYYVFGIGRKKIDGGVQNAPEIRPHISGNSRNSLGGQIENYSGTTLVVEYIEIDGRKTNINQPFTKLTHLNNLNIDHTIFEEVKPAIKVKIRYRTLGGDTFDYLVDAVQQYRQGDGKYNVGLGNSPTVKRVGRY